MTRSKQKGFWIKLSVFCALFAAIAILTVGSVLYAGASEDHSNHIALTAEFLSNHQSADGTTYELPTGNYYLPANLDVDRTVSIADGAAVSLCLNGNRLRYTGNSTYRSPVISLINASLTVSDCSGDDSGRIDGNNSSGSVIYSHTATLTLTGGGITGGRGTVVYDPYQNAANIDRAYYEKDGYEVDGDYLEEGYGYGDEDFYNQGGGIYALDTKFSMTGGAIYGNGVASATARWSENRDVIKYVRYQNEDGTGDMALNYEGPRVSNEVLAETGLSHRVTHYGDAITFSRAQGGGVFIGTTYANRTNLEKKSTFVMSGGAISNNVSYLHGAGLFVHNVDFEMRGGVVGGEKQYTASYGGVAFENGGNVATPGLAGYSSTQGGGIYIYRGIARGAGNDVKLTGNAEISYNEARSDEGAYGSSAAVLGSEGSELVISGNVLITHNVGASILTSSGSLEMTGGRIEENVSHGAVVSASVTESGDNILRVLGGYIRNNTGGALGSASSAGRAGGAPLSLNCSKKPDTEVTVSGVTITGNEMFNSAAVTIMSGVVTMSDTVISNNVAKKYYNQSGTLVGGSNAGLSVSNAVSLTMERCTVSENRAEGGNPGLVLTGTATGAYTVKDTRIAGNVAESGNNGGIYVSTSSSVVANAGGTYRFENVTVSDNSVSGSYGGIYVASSNIAKVNVAFVNTNITNNTAGGSYGGLCLGYNVEATMTGGNISGNSAGKLGTADAAGANGTGGGLALASASATVANANVTLADGSKETVEFDRVGATLKATGVTVTGNTATGSGAGVWIGRGAVQTTTGKLLAGASLELTDGAVTDNKNTGYYNTAGNLASGAGGGVYVDGVGSTAALCPGVFTMTNGSISGNSSLSHGGGIYSTCGEVTLNNVHVTNNTAGLQRGVTASTGAGNAAQGGGIYILGNNSTPTALTFSMTGGSISGNVSTGNGGGLYANGNGANLRLNLSLDGVTVSGNRAIGNYDASGALVNVYGGGLYLTALESTITDTSVTYNTTNFSGGGIYLNGTTVRATFAGKIVVDGNAADANGKTTASNVKLSASGVVMIISADGLAEGSKIGVTGDTNWMVTDNLSGVSILSYFFSDTTSSDSTTSLIIAVADETTQDLKLVKGTGDVVEVPENPAKTITVELSVSDAKGGSLLGAGSVYYGGEGEIEETYTVIISDGYYFSAMVVNGDRYYIDTFGQLHRYSAESRTNVLVGSSENPFRTDNGLTFTLKLDTELDVNTLRLEVQNIVSPFTVSDRTAEYDGTGKSVTVEPNSVGGGSYSTYLTSLINGSVTEYLVKGAWTTSLPFDAGTYAVRIGWTATPYVGGSSYTSDDYALTISSQVWDVGTTNIRITLSQDEFVYDGSAEYTPLVTVFDTARNAALTVNDYVATVSNNNGAGTGLVTVTGIGNYSGILTVEFEIAKFRNVLTYTGDTNFTRTYNGLAQSVSLSGFSAAYGDVTVTASDGAVTESAGVYTFTAVNAGTYTVTFSSYGDNNYQSYDVTVTVVIQKAKTVIDVSNVNKTLTYDPVSVEQYVDLGGVVSGGITLSEVTVTNGGAYSASANTVSVTDAGTYHVTLTVNETANYEGATEEFDIVVSPYGVSKPAQDNTVYVYDGEDKTYKIASSGYYTISGVRTMRDAGTATITVSLNSANYRWSDGSTGDATYTFTVNKAQNNINTSAVTNRLTYNGASQTVSLGGVTATNGAENLLVSVGNGTYDAATNSVILRDAGTYTVSLTINESNNYLAASTTFVITVDPKLVGKPAADTSAFTYTGTVQTYALAAGDDYTIVGDLSRTNAGRTTITVALKDRNNTRWNDGTTADAIYTFEIAKADPDYTVPSGLTAKAGDKLSSIALPEGWSWNNPNLTVGGAVTEYNATYTPADTENYNTVTLALSVRVPGSATDPVQTVSDAPVSVLIVFAVLDAALLAVVIAMTIVKNRKKK